MVAFSKVKAGDVLYDVHRERMGNTTMSRLGCWKVLVVSVDPESETAECKWNMVNRPKTYTRRMLERLRRSPPKGVVT